MSKWQSIFKWLMYSLMLIIFFLLETAVLTRVSLLGVHPLVVPLIVSTVAVFEGPWSGAFFGFSAGIFYDAFIPLSEGFYSIIFLIGCYLIGYLSQSVFQKNFLTSFLWNLIFLSFAQLMFFFIFFLLQSKAGLSALFTTYLPEVGVSMLFSPLIYFFSRGIYRGFTNDI